MSEIATKVISVVLAGMLMLSALAVTAMPSAVSASVPVPVIPTSFYGNVTVYGDPAPNNTVVTGKIVGAVGSPGNGTITVTEAGKYGVPPPDIPRLEVTTDNVYDIGKTIEFYVQLPGGEAVKANETATYNSHPNLLDLTVVTTYNLTMAVVGNGTVTPGNGTYTSGDMTINATADSGWQFANWTTDDMSEIASPTSAEATLTLDKNKTVTATFAIRTYTITATAGANGSIKPSGAVVVNCGADQTFNITADACYNIEDVVVDDESQGAVANYTFTNVTANHTINATFAIKTYTITATAGANGTILPSGAVPVDCGANQTFNITADACYNIDDVVVDGSSVGAVANYTFTNVTANHTINANFIVAAPVANFSANVIRGLAPLAVHFTDLSTNAPTNWSWDFGDGNTSSLQHPVNIYAEGTYNVSLNASNECGWNVTTKLNYITVANQTYNLTVTSNGCCPINVTGAANGTVPANATEEFPDIISGTDVSLEAVAGDCCEFDGWNVDGSLVEGNPITVTMDSNHTAVATCSTPGPFTITATAGTNGTILPSGAVPVDCGADQTFNITADACYDIDDVVVDDVSQGAVANYTFTNVTANHTINATFAIRTYTITATAGTNGTILPSGAVPVNCGADQAFSIVNDTGYKVANVLVDGSSVSAVPNYTFTNVTANHTISATFTRTGNFTTTLSAGWNLVSTPILLDANYTSLGKIFDAPSLSNISASYSWDGAIWVPLDTTYELLPLDAIYVKVSSGGSATATFVPSQKLSGLPSREVQEGLNLIGPAPALEAGDFPAMALEDALVSIKEVGNVTGYTMVVSPSHNQPGWAYPPAGEGKDLLPYNGYWVVMENGPDTLYGFSATPI